MAILDARDREQFFCEERNEGIVVVLLATVWIKVLKETRSGTPIRSAPTVGLIDIVPELLE